MDHFLTPGLVVDGVSGVLFIALGMFVVLSRRDLRANRVFALFSAAFGLSLLSANVGLVFVAWGNIDLLGPTMDAILVASGVFTLIAAGALFRLALVFPAPLVHKRASMLLLPALAALLAFMNVFEWSGFRGPGPLRAGYIASFLIMFAAFLFVLVLLPLRHSFDRNLVERQRRQVRLFGLAILLYPGLLAGATTLFFSVSLYSRLVGVALLAMVSALWLVAAARAPPTQHSVLRWLAWAALALPLAGMMAVVLQGDYERAIDSGIMGAARAVGLVVLAYAILRTSLFDIDLKMKWALGKGTMAGIFLGIFFIVANVGQALFTQTLGWAFGGIAAGILLFAITPLQRLAHRVADTAMPQVKDTPEYRLVRKREVYLAAVEGALADGHITEKERDMLATLADQLGLSAGQARSLEREARSTD